MMGVTAVVKGELEGEQIVFVAAGEVDLRQGVGGKWEGEQGWGGGAGGTGRTWSGERRAGGGASGVCGSWGGDCQTKGGATWQGG